MGAVICFICLIFLCSDKAWGRSSDEVRDVIRDAKKVGLNMHLRHKKTL